MRNLRFAQGLLALSLVTSVAGCERRGEEVRPEPITLSRLAPQRQGAEHGQDPRRAQPDAPARPASQPASAADEEEVDADAEDEAEGTVRSHRPAKRRRTGGPASRDLEAQGESPLRAKRLVVARKVEGREPVGVARSFDASKVSEVAVFVELANEDRASGKIAIRFIPPNSAAFDVGLNVGASPRWRTWATTKRPLEEGTWTVRITDENGALVASTTFEVTP